MDKRQFERCVEMSLLHALNKKTYVDISNLDTKQIRLQIKKRIYLKNRDALEEIPDESERKSKLHDAYERLQEDYIRILEKVKFSNKRPLEDDEDSSSAKKQK
ncbi:unnamed protein product [Ambrosiozyma monospora]|uniref:Unnamed protein product n=1 Tax=Ambrosiozyma monospora TaxID=43982 RepID=A0ACB5STL7_AMBMO|nr:unnamed protein product [Ambrosiozyma monospora]